MGTKLGDKRGPYKTTKHRRKNGKIRCKNCDRWQKEERFPKDKRGTKLTRCLECINLIKYGIDYSILSDMLIAHNGRCAICKEKETKKSRWSNEVRRLAIDHCHKTGKVRGLLCGRCNTVLGMMNDNTALLLSAVEYLDRSV